MIKISSHACHFSFLFLYLWTGALLGHMHEHLVILYHCYISSKVGTPKEIETSCRTKVILPNQIGFAQLHSQGIESAAKAVLDSNNQLGITPKYNATCSDFRLTFSSSHPTAAQSDIQSTYPVYTSPHNADFMHICWSVFFNKYKQLTLTGLESPAQPHFLQDDYCDNVIRVSRSSVTPAC